MTPLRRVASILCAVTLLAACTPVPPDPSPGPSAAVPSMVPTPSATFPAGATPDRQVDLPVADPPEIAGVEAAPPGEGLGRYFDQQLAWQPCDELECATALAPLDWAEPNGTAITLALRRRPASAEPRLGALFINPGGPGGAATDFVASFPHSGLERYDIVGVDPRGSGASTPVVCADPPATDAYYDLDFSPNDEAEKQALIDGSKDFAAACRANSGALLDHLGSVDAVRDFDLVRHLVGDASFNYLGVSYGTYLGALYAEMYPANVGRLVLDAAVNITDDDDVIQAQGFERALNAFIDDCAARTCTLGSTSDEVRATIISLLDQLDARPLLVGDRKLTQSQALSGMALFLYVGADAYLWLESAIVWATRQGDGAPLLSAADQLNDRRSDGSYGTLAYAFPAIGCKDSHDDGVADEFRRWDEQKSVAPVFGTYSGPNIVCPVWPVKPDPFVRITGEGAAPIVVIGSTGDNATPYEHAVTMAEQLASGVLLTRFGAGHGSYTKGNACITSAVQRFLNDGIVPDDGTRCQ